jgi:hypothetical protein
MMDALYFYRHSRFKDVEILFSLRGLDVHAPWIRKVWIFGDRPAFLTDDRTVAEHVPHEYVARVGDFRTPVTNFFLMFYLSSLIPELTPEYLWFCDDFILLDDLSEPEARQDRYLEDLGEVRNRGRGLWKDSLWRTYDLLKRLGYTGYNFETHTPTYFTKRRILEAYCDFKDFITQDRWQGMLGPTAILNHAYKVEPGMTLTSLRDQDLRAGFHGKRPGRDEIEERSRGKKFLNFDDEAFGPDLLAFLKAKFPRVSKFEDPQKLLLPTAE